VTLQVAGADQWGNSIAGVELIRRIEGAEAHVWTAPLIINKETGVKFGKSETGAVWLDPAKTSPNDFYQFWINCDDAGVEDYLKIYTLLSKEEIAAVMAEFNANRAGRAAQKRLAKEVTTLVHGTEAAQAAAGYAESLKGSLQDGAGKEITVSEGSSIVDALVAGNLVASKTEGRQILADGGVYVNDNQTSKEQFEASDFNDGQLVLRRGKKLQNTVLVRLQS
jgi:tyrosyl-tRNA synthetase